MKTSITFYIVTVLVVLVAVGIIIFNLPKIENFLSSVDLYRDPKVTDYVATYNQLSQTLSDANDMMVMNRCVMMDKTFFETLSSFPAKADYYTHYFQTLLQTNVDGSTATSFMDVQNRIKQELYELYEQINLNATTPIKIPGPVYALVFQAPNYPDMSMMNWQIGGTGFDFLPYNGATFSASSAMNMMVTCLIMFPRCAKDGTPLKLSDSEVVKKTAHIFDNITDDQLCFIQCLNSPNLACGCSSQKVTTLDGVNKPLYSSKCLSSDGDGGDVVNYGIVYQLNPDFPEFMQKAVFENGTPIALTETALLEYPPIGIAKGNRWLRDTSDTVLSLIDNKTYAKYKTEVTGKSYGNGTYIAWANGIWAYDHNNPDWEWAPSGAFDKDEGDRPSTGGGGAGWHVSESMGIFTNSADAKIPPYLVLQLPLPIVLRQYSLQARAGCCQFQMPTKWVVYGSADPQNDNSWNIVDSQDNIVWKDLAQTQTFVTTNKKAYTAYKIECIRNGSPTPNNIHIGEWRMYAKSDAELSGLANRDLSLKNTTPSFVLGTAVMGPWGNQNFKDEKAHWVWNIPNAQSNAPAGFYITFKRVWENSTGKDIKATIHIVIDDIAKVYLNDSFLQQVSGGWWTPDYPKIPVTISKGKNLFTFMSMNTGGPAGLVYSVIDSNGNVLFNSDEKTVFANQ